MDLSYHKIKELYPIARYLSIRYIKNFNKVELLEEINNRIENLSECQLRQFKSQPFYHEPIPHFKFDDKIFAKPKNPEKRKNMKNVLVENGLI